MQLVLACIPSSTPHSRSSTTLSRMRVPQYLTKPIAIVLIYTFSVYYPSLAQTKDPLSTTSSRSMCLSHHNVATHSSRTRFNQRSSPKLVLVFNEFQVQQTLGKLMDLSVSGYQLRLTLFVVGLCRQHRFQPTP